eukprot:3720141-Alexandrium_andersonii.AAC.1
MMMLAFFTTGWAKLTRLCGAVPRALADDLMVEAAGGAQEPAFGRAVTATLDLLDEACCFVS